jgi:osmotically inducible protein OsmC
MPTREANARWEGPMPGGNGTMAFGSGAYEGRYTFESRFEEGEGTNPEELIAAAHAGCFSMAFAGNLQRAGYEPKSVASNAQVVVEKSGDGFAITRIALDSTASVDGIAEDEFQQIAEETRKGCPVSVALASVPEITLNAKLA